MWVEMGREREGHDVRKDVDALRTICDKMVLSAGHVAVTSAQNIAPIPGSKPASSDEHTLVPNPQLNAQTTVSTYASTVDANIAQEYSVSFRFILP